ncbi:MAG: metalloregulator ArsR/SmtB family transcription factor [Candidatus Dormibacteraeota bacterium]|nr:metalloregulator ArsR/SmtB family transcription factor [Candidatus Dormibacteraeota bacterium]
MKTELLPVRQRGAACCELPLQVDPGWAQDTAETLKVLGDPTRLSMVAALWAAEAPVCICDFTAAYDLTQGTISHHMGKLKAAGLVESSKQGIWIYYRLREQLPALTTKLLATLVEPLAEAAMAGSTGRPS